MEHRCPVCRTRRASFASLLRHERERDHKAPCRCGGYHFPHRPGSPTCDAAPYVRLNRAKAAGATREERLDAMIDDTLSNDFSRQPKSAECPF